MSCPGGCLNGGGQLLLSKDPNHAKEVLERLNAQGEALFASAADPKQ